MPKSFKKDFVRAIPHVMTRANAICEVCKGHRATGVHHKKGRLAPDANELDNLLAVCRACHQYIHQHPAESYSNGWMLKRLATPEGDET